MRGDSSECWRETPPLTSSSVLNSNLFWEAAVSFAKDLLFLNSSLWFDIFYSWPRGEVFFSNLVQVEPLSAMPREQVAVKSLAQGCFGRYWCAGVQTIDTAEQNSQPPDHVDPTWSQSNEVWQLTSCKTSHRSTEDWWMEEMIYEQMKDVLAAGRLEGWMDGWRDKEMDKEMDGWMKE